MNPTYDFHDCAAVVTGAASGMGLATAKAFADSGAAVVLADRNEQTLQAAAAEWRRCLARASDATHASYTPSRRAG